MSKTESLNFHQTFPPTPMYIGRLLQIADGTVLNRDEISAKTGIPQGKSAGKVAPHIAYAKKMGLLVKDGAELRRTSLGNTVMREDPTLSEELTQWLCHALLSSSSGAVLWHYLLRVLLPQNNGTISMDMIKQNAQIEFGKNVKLGPVFTTYTKQLTKIDYMEATTTSVSIHPHTINREFVYVYGYALLHEWDNLLSGKSEVTAMELNQLTFAPTFAWPEDEAFEALTLLEEIGILRINRQLHPFTLQRFALKEDLIPKLYCLLL